MNRYCKLLFVALMAGLIGLSSTSMAQTPEGEAAPVAAEAADGAGPGRCCRRRSSADGDAAGDDAAAADDATPPAEDDATAEADAAVTPTPSPWSTGLIISYIALLLGGGSAVIGIWVDRDATRPSIFGVAMSVLIASACLVGAVQGYLDSTGAIQKQQDLDRMLGMVNEIAIASGDPELIKLAEDASGEKLDIPPPAPEPPAGEADGVDAGDGADADGAAPSDADVLAGEGDAAPADGEPAPTPDAP